MNFPLLSVLTVMPFSFAILLLLIKGRKPEVSRLVAITCSLVILFSTGFLWHIFDPGRAGIQFEETYNWIPALHIQYHLGCDGLGILMLLLSAIVTVIAVLASSTVKSRTQLYYSLVFFLEACLFGSFTALNFIHWFTYWELSLIPAYFLIKMWGGDNRGPASTKFLIYTVTGSIAMFLSFIALYLITGTFDFLDLARNAQQGDLFRPIYTEATPICVAHSTRLFLFLGVFLGLAVKIPVVPFHTWLPDAYSEAPTGVTILLTGAMSKMGIFGLLRILLPLFAPQMHETYTPLMLLTLATIIASTFAAYAQTDLKRIFAYSSINHLGYCLMGIIVLTRTFHPTSGSFAAQYAAMGGSLLQMFNHGLTAASIFWFISLLEARSGGLTGLNDFGGLRKVMPVLAGFMGIALFSSLGLPGLNGFISEFLIFRGSFAMDSWSTSLSVIGLLITALFILKVIQHVFTGPLNERWREMPDLSRTEQFTFLPALILMFAIGLYPQIALGHLNATVVEFVQRLHF